GWSVSLVPCYSSHLSRRYPYILFFTVNHTTTPDIPTLSLHDALPICCSCALHLTPPPMNCAMRAGPKPIATTGTPPRMARGLTPDRKSTRLNSSHGSISYAVFCLKKKKSHDIILML